MLALRKSFEAEYFSNKTPFKSKEEYLLWVKNWKGSIKFIEHHIRQYKLALHKEIKATDGYKKFVREQGTGYFESAWANWSSQNQVELNAMRSLATRMYELRAEMKQRSWAMKQKAAA